MASPQIENGHIKIANELWDALTAYRLPGEQRQCLDVIIRKTYGFNKKQDAIALSQFVEMTGIVKPHVVRALSALQEKKIITVTKKGNAPANMYEIIKDFSKWVPLPKKVTLPKKVMSVTKKGNPSLPKMVPTKDNTTKDTITKDRHQKKFTPPTQKEVTDYFLEKGFPEALAIRAFEYYENGDPPWTDANKKPVSSWKQKMLAVWMRPENKNYGNEQHKNQNTVTPKVMSIEEIEELTRRRG